MSIREDRLLEDLRHMEALREQSSMIDFISKGTPPDEYLVTFRCRGMLNPGRISEEHVAEFYLHAEYPLLPPQVSFLTPIFHPNIVAAIQAPSFQQEIGRALDRAPDEAARRRILDDLTSNEEIFKAHVCLDALDYNWTPAITLEKICIELGEMIQLKRHNSGDPLNPIAARWVREHSKELPIDSRNLLDLAVLPEIRILGEACSDSNIAVRILERENADV